MLVDGGSGKFQPGDDVINRETGFVLVKDSENLMLTGFKMSDHERCSSVEANASPTMGTA